MWRALPSRNLSPCTTTHFRDGDQRQPETVTDATVPPVGRLPSTTLVRAIGARRELGQEPLGGLSERWRVQDARGDGNGALGSLAIDHGDLNPSGAACDESELPGRARRTDR